MTLILTENNFQFCKYFRCYVNCFQKIKKYLIFYSLSIDFYNNI